MRKIVHIIVALSLVAMLGACTYIPGRTNLGQVAKDTGMKNITTGDGTFENYTATGYHTGLEIGIAVGLPGICKFMELYPVDQDNEALLGDVARAAKRDGADAMINVTPHEEWYTGFPFFIVGLYFDNAAGTGIKTK